MRIDQDSLSDSPHGYSVNGQPYLRRVGGHIPGALAVNFLALRDTHQVGNLRLDFQFPTAAAFQSLMQGIGLKSNEPIVIAPTGDSAVSLQEGALLALELMVYGVPPTDVALLNGGTHAWIASGYPVSTHLIFPSANSDWRAKRGALDCLAHTADVRKQRNHDGLLLDARPLDQFMGLTHSPVVALPGHIQGATALPAEVMYTEGHNGAWYFLSAAHYKKIVANLGIDLKTQPNAIVYCNTGQYAAGAWFILDRIVGDAAIRTDEGSLYNWEHRGLPVVGL